MDKETEDMLIFWARTMATVYEMNRPFICIVGPEFDLPPTIVSYNPENDSLEIIGELGGDNMYII